MRGIDEEIDRWTYIEDSNNYPIPFLREYDADPYRTLVDELDAGIRYFSDAPTQDAADLRLTPHRQAVRHQLARHSTASATFLVTVLGVLGEPRSGKGSLTMVGWALIGSAVVIGLATLWETHLDNVQAAAVARVAARATAGDAARVDSSRGQVLAELDRIESVLRMVVFATSARRGPWEKPPATARAFSNPPTEHLDEPSVVRALTSFSLTPRFSLGRAGPYFGPYGTDMRSVDAVLARETSVATERVRGLLVTHARYLPPEATSALQAVLASSFLRFVRELESRPNSKPLTLVTSEREGEYLQFIADLGTAKRLMRATAHPSSGPHNAD
jgi:hypothetical protein